MDVLLYVSPQRLPPKRPADKRDRPLDPLVTCQGGIVPPLENLSAEMVGHKEAPSGGFGWRRGLAVTLADSLF
ncbi:hypothetical protein ROHU_000307 [Labeo rohita]|uniref:Uncharacterized protein n=1 Tax=Labeo rohita TaxID=84645 RepID=A0A498P2W7_LABRO|nr:hypothetical protein ROHU_003564 [Labeo rohita]RXN38555.1 hypothetical protein ROHU_001003 [Labeo rohita]RXN39307.1 hypothetical protein ROHU_000307 [Labeo rohita]